MAQIIRYMLIAWLVLGTVSCAVFTEQRAGREALLDGLLEKGSRCALEDSLESALKHYELALVLAPENPTALEQRQRILTTLHVLADMHYRQGLNMMAQGKLADSRQEFLEALRLWPDHPKAREILRPDVQSQVLHSKTHTVRQGENLSLLAFRYYGDSRYFPVLAMYNDLRNASMVKAGESIKIPEIEGVPFFHDASTESRQAGRHQVKAGKATSTGAAKRDAARQLSTDLRKVRASMQQKDYQTALFELNQLIAVNPGEQVILDHLHEAHLAQAQQLFDAQEYVKARSEFEAALCYKLTCEACWEYIQKIQSIYEETYRDPGLELFKQQKYNEAAIKFEKLLELNPYDSQTLAYLSRCHYQQGMQLFGQRQYLGAMDEFDRALHYQSDCQECRSYKIKSAAAYKEIHYNRGVAFFGKEKLNEAISEWALVLALDPDYQRVQEYIAKARSLLEKLETMPQ